MIQTAITQSSAVFTERDNRYFVPRSIHSVMTNSAFPLRINYHNIQTQYKNVIWPTFICVSGSRLIINFKNLTMVHSKTWSSHNGSDISLYTEKYSMARALKIKIYIHPAAVKLSLHTRKLKHKYCDNTFATLISVHLQNLKNLNTFMFNYFRLKAF